MLGRNNFNERLRKLEGQNKKERFSIRKLTVGAASVLLGFSFMGLSSQKAQAETTDPNEDAAKTEQSAQTVADGKKDAGEVASNAAQNDQVKQQKPARKPQLSTFAGLTAFLRSEEEPASDSGSTSSTGTESSNASSSSSSTSSSSSNASSSSTSSSSSAPSSAATDEQGHDTTASAASSSGQDEQQAANSDPKPDEDIIKDDEQQKAKEKPVVGPQASAAADLQDSINNANSFKNSDAYALAVAGPKPAFEASLISAQNLLNTYNANHASVTDEQLTSAKTDLDTKNAATRSFEVSTWNELTLAAKSTTKGLQTISLKNDIRGLNDLSFAGGTWGGLTTVIEGNGYTLSVSSFSNKGWLGSNGLVLRNLMVVGTKKSESSEATVTSNDITLENVTGQNASFNIAGSSGYNNIKLKGTDSFINNAADSLYLFNQAGPDYHLIVEDGAKVNVNATGMSLSKAHYNGIDVGKNASITYNLTQGNIIQGDNGLYFNVAEGGSLKINLHGNTGTTNNKILSLIASKPKAVQLTSDNPGDTFSFGTLNIDGERLGLSDGTHKWMFDRAGDTSARPLDLLGNKTSFNMALMDNQTPISDIPKKGKASANYTSVNGTASDADTLAADMLTANQNKGGTGLPSFLLGPDLYGGSMSRAGVLNMWADGIAAHKGQVALGSAVKYLQANNDRDGVPESISNLQNNHIITDISWLPNKAMDPAGNLTDNGIIKTADGGVLNDSMVGPTPGDLGNTVIRVKYDDDTYDDVPIKVTVVEAKAKFGYRATTASGVVPTSSQAEDALSFLDSNGDDAETTVSTNWHMNYEWVHADPDEHGNYTPLTSDDVQASGSHNVAIIAHYLNNAGQDDGQQLIKLPLIVNPYSMNGNTIIADTTRPLTVHLREPASVDGFAVNTPSDFTTASKIDDLITIKTPSGTPVTPSDVVRDIEWFSVPSGIGDRQNAQVRLHYKDDSYSEPLAIKINLVGGISTGVDTALDRGNAGDLTAESAKAALTPASVSTIEAAYPDKISYSWAANKQGTGNIDVNHIDNIGSHSPAYVVIEYGDGTKQFVQVYLHVRGNAEKYFSNISVATITSHVNAGNSELNDSLASATTVGTLTPGTDFTTSWTDYPKVNQGGLIAGIMKQTGKAQFTFSDGSVAEKDVEINVVGGQSNNKDTVINRGAELTAAQAQAALTQDSIDRINQYYPHNVTYSWAGNADGSGNPDVNSSDIVGQHHTAYVMIDFGNGGQKQAVAVNLHVRGKAEQAEAEGKIKYQSITTHVNASANTLDDQLKSALSVDGYTTSDYTVSWSHRPEVTTANLVGGKKQSTGQATIFFNADHSQVTEDIVVNVVGGEAVQQVVPINWGTAADVAFTQDTAKAALTNTSVTNVAASYPGATYSWSKDEFGSSLPNISTADAAGVNHTAYIIIDFGDSTKQAIQVSYHVKGYQEQFAGKITVADHFKMHASDDAPQPPANIKDFTDADRIKTLIKIQDVADSSKVIKRIIWADAADTPVSTSGQAGQTQSGKIKLVYLDDSESDAISVNVDIVGAKLKGNRTFFTGIIPKAKDMVDNPQDLQGFGVTDNDYSWVNPDTHTLLQDTDFTPGAHDIALRVEYPDGTTQYVKLTVTVSTMKEQYKDKISISKITTHVGASINQVLKDVTSVTDLTPGTDYTVSWRTAPDITDADLVDGSKDCAGCKAYITYRDGSVSDDKDVTVKVVGGQANMEGVVVDLNAAPTENDAKAALTADSLAKIGTLVDSYTWTRNSDGSGTVDTAHPGDNNSAYVVIHYSDGTTQKVHVKLHVKGLSEQYSDVSSISSINTHVGADLNKALKEATSVTGLTYGSDYTVSWKPSDTPDISANYLVNGTKTISGTAIITYRDGSVSADKTVSVTVVGGQANQAGVTVGVGAVLTENDAKSALSRESLNAVSSQAASYSWARNSNGTGDVDTSQSGNNDSAYVVIHYSDGTTQSVKVNLHIIGMSDMYADKITVNAINTHVGADINAALAPAITVTGLTSGTDYRVTWKTSAPDITEADLTDGAKIVTGTAIITYRDGSISADKGVTVNVVGGQANTGGITVDLNAELSEQNAKDALTAKSLGKIGSQASSYTWAKNPDGSGVVDTSHPGDNDVAYVVIHYSDGTTQNVKVKLHVRALNEQYADKISIASINTHVGADINAALAAATTVTGLTSDTDYRVTWKTSAPDITEAGLTDGAKTVTGTAIITYRDGSISADKDVTVNVIGGQANTGGITVDLNAELSEENAKAALTAKSLGKISSQATSFTWGRNPDGSGAVDTSHPGDNDSAYVVIHYSDSTTQNVKVKLHVKGLSEQYADKISITPVDTHVGADIDAALTAATTINGLTSGTDYRVAWETPAPDITAPEDGLPGGAKVVTGTAKITYRDGSTSDGKDVTVNVVGGEANSSGVTVDLNEVPTEQNAKAALTLQSLGKIGSKATSYSWARVSDGSGTVDTSHGGDNPSAYVVIHYSDGTTQTVKAKLHVKGLSEQYADKTNIATINTHVGADINAALTNATTITGLTSGADYTVAWKTTAPDITAPEDGLPGGSKVVTSTAIITYRDGSRSDDKNVTVNVVGGQASAEGVTVALNASLTEENAKTALTTESLGKIKDNVTSYSWAKRFDGSGAVDTSQSGDNNSAYVVIHYSDNTTQSVKVKLHINGMKDQYGNSIRIAQINTHVGADINAALTAATTITGLTGGRDYTVTWKNPAPDISETGLTNGAKTITDGKAVVRFSDGSISDDQSVTVNVVGAMASATGVTVPLRTTLTSANAQEALTAASLDKIHSLVSNYSWCSSRDGSGTVDTSHPGNNDSAYVKVKYSDNTTQIVKVKLTVKGMNEQYTNIAVSNISTHVNAVAGDALRGKVTVPGLTEGNGAGQYKVSWQTPPDLSATGLVNGVKNVTGTALVTFGDNTTTTEIVNAQVVGGQPGEDITLNAGTELGLAETGVSLTSRNQIASFLDSHDVYKWAATIDGSGSPDITTLGSRTIYVIIAYNDSTKQAVPVKLTVKPAALPAASHAVKQTNNIKMHAVTGEYENQGELGNYDGYLANTGSDDALSHISGVSWINRPSLNVPTQTTATAPNGRIKITFNDGAAEQELAVKVDVIGGVANGNKVNYTIGRALTVDDTRGVLTQESRDLINENYGGRASYSWAKESDGSGVPDTTSLDEHTAYIVIDYGDGKGKQIIPVAIHPKTDANQYDGQITAADTLTLHAKGLSNDVASQIAFKDPAFINSVITIPGISPSSVINHLEWTSQPINTGNEINNGTPHDITGKFVAVYNDTSKSKEFTAKINLIGGRKGVNVVNVNQRDTMPAGRDQLTLDSYNAISARYPNATYSWSTKIDGSIAAPDTTNYDEPGTNKPIYLVIKYAANDNDVQIVQFNLHIKGIAEQNKDSIHVSSIKTHVHASSSELATDLAAAISVPGLNYGDYQLAWGAGEPNVTAAREVKDYAVNVTFTGSSSPISVTVPVSVVGGQSNGQPLRVNRGVQLNNTTHVAAVLTSDSLRDLTNLPNHSVTYSWSDSAAGTSPATTNNSHPVYLIINYGDATQAVAVNLYVEQAAITASSITTHVNAPDIDNKLAAAVTVPGLNNGSDYTVSWVTPPDLSADGLDSSGKKVQNYQVKVHYNDENIDKFVSVGVTVKGAVANTNPFAVDQGNIAAFTDQNAKAALTNDSVNAITSLVAGYSWSKDGESSELPNIAVGDGDENATRPAYVIVSYLDGTKQAVRVKLHVNKVVNGDGSDVQVKDITAHVGTSAPQLEQLLDDNIKLPSSVTSHTAHWQTLPNVTDTGLINGRKQVTGTAEITINGTTHITRLVTVNVVGAQATGNAIKVNQKRVLSSGTIVDSSEIEGCLNTSSIQSFTPIYTWSGGIDTTANGTAPIVVNFNDGGTQIVSVPLQVIIPIGGTIETYQGASLSSADAQRAISNYGDLIKATGCTWAKTPDTSTLGTHSETVHLTFGDSTPEGNVSVLVNITSRPSSNSMADKNPAIGGSISVPQYTDLASDTSYAARGISNSSSLVGATYRWDTSSLPNTSAPVGSKFNGFVNVSYPDGSAASVGVGVTIVAPINNNVVIGHDTPVYDPSGKTDGTIIASGSVVPTQGSKVINGENTVNISHSNDYIPSSNVTGTKVKLIHNAYIYKRNGKLKDKHVLPRGMEVTVYGEPVTIRGKQYFQVGKNQYIKKNNFPPTGEWKTPLPAQNEPETIPAVEKTLMHDSYRYDGTGSQLDQVLLRAGSQIKTYGKATINKESYYVVDDNVYLPAENIDAKKRKLKRNACVYDQDGDRLKKKLKKGKKVKTYGDTVMINDKEYYIIGNKQYVRKGNFGRKK
ncbi:Rib/alpha-like domain-containing protein [Lactobacillus sp. ESL0791]|uniref:Rib/alpha-like domain-containing protein n=1 Tax=Lactobacillus sp. ESL0791 TaxID=2983234 RepID=UPI0023F8BD99|nr:Rib/alpha-like domain-containing protein [Lactobacillus sp. ESL0791]MDF7639693.1 Rib/alpha-like domain-containing protein [Lactobacillus sp. ESL0791]